MDAMSVLTSLDAASSNISVRDKSMKIVQYGTRMILGFYGKQLSGEFTSALMNAKDAATISRKCFRFLKSISCIANILKMLGTDPSSTSSSDPAFLIFRILEEGFYASFYYHDNKYLLSRLGLVSSFNMEREENRTNLTWFLAEASGLGALLLQYRSYMIRIRSIKWRIARLKAQQETTSGSKKEAFTTVLPTAPLTFDLSYLERELERLEGMQSYYIIEFVKYGLNVFISGNSAKAWEKLFGVRASDSITGLFGTLASILSLYSGFAFKRIKLDAEEPINPYST